MRKRHKTESPEKKDPFFSGGFCEVFICDESEVKFAHFAAGKTSLRSNFTLLGQNFTCPQGKLSCGVS